LIGCRVTGRQHDVSECMDNCVFQIETALLKFDGLDESEDGKSSVVKRYVGPLNPCLVKSFNPAEQPVLRDFTATTDSTNF
jgi:hypothetical protein